MLLTAADMRKFAKLGASLQTVAFVIEILERNGATQSPATKVQRREPLHKGLSSTERSRIYRAKQKSNATGNATAEPVAATVVSPTPPSLLPLETNKIEVLKEKKSKGVGIARGHRLPEDFIPDASCEKVAREMHYSQAQWKAAIDNFFDYWRGVPGSRGMKLDWQATCRNSLRNIRNATSNGKGNGHGAIPRPNSVDRASEALLAKLRAKRESGGGDSPSDLLAQNVPRLR